MLYIPLLPISSSLISSFKKQLPNKKYRVPHHEHFPNTLINLSPLDPHIWLQHPVPRQQSVPGMWNIHPPRPPTHTTMSNMHSLNFYFQILKLIPFVFCLATGPETFVFCLATGPETFPKPSWFKISVIIHLPAYEDGTDSVFRNVGI